MRPRDMAKIGYLIINHGLWHGRKILSEKWIKVSTKGYHDGDWVMAITGGVPNIKVEMNFQDYFRCRAWRTKGVGRP